MIVVLVTLPERGNQYPSLSRSKRNLSNIAKVSITIMPSRRRFLTATAGLLPLAGCCRYTESGNIQIENRTRQEVLTTITVKREDGLFSKPKVVYEDTFRQFPTRHHGATITDVVRPGTYRVRVEAETKEGQTGSENRPVWNVSGETNETLIVAIESGIDIEFLT